MILIRFSQPYFDFFFFFCCIGILQCRQMSQWCVCVCVRTLLYPSGVSQRSPKGTLSSFLSPLKYLSILCIFVRFFFVVEERMREGVGQCMLRFSASGNANYWSVKRDIALSLTFIHQKTHQRRLRNEVDPRSGIHLYICYMPSYGCTFQAAAISHQRATWLSLPPANLLRGAGG